MKIWFISDTHEQHEKLDVPTGVNVVIHSGDEANHHEPHLNAYQSQVFFNWYRSLPIPIKIFVPGNHSTALHAGMVDTTGVAVLIDEMFEPTGLHPVIYGSPWTPAIPTGRRWVYTRKRNQMAVVWDKIPYSDILVTHGPPKGIMDRTFGFKSNTRQLMHVGDKALMNAVQRRKPTIHAFGHLHDEREVYNRGVMKRDGITFVNASVVDLRGRLVGNGEVLEI